MKRAKKTHRRAASLAICRARVHRAAHLFAACLAVPVSEVFRLAGLSKADGDA